MTISKRRSFHSSLAPRLHGNMVSLKVCINILGVYIQAVLHPSPHLSTLHPHPPTRSINHASELPAQQVHSASAQYTSKPPSHINIKLPKNMSPGFLVMLQKVCRDNEDFVRMYKPPRLEKKKKPICPSRECPGPRMGKRKNLGL